MELVDPLPRSSGVLAGYGPAEYRSLRRLLDNILQQDAQYVEEKLRSTVTEPTEPEMEESIDIVPQLTREEQFKLLVTNLDGPQTDRFEAYHRTSLARSQIKRLAGTVINQSISENMRVLLQAVGKLYVCEIIELALGVQRRTYVRRCAQNRDRRIRLARRLKRYLRRIVQVNERRVLDDASEESQTSDSSSDGPARKDLNVLKSRTETHEHKLALVAVFNRTAKEFNSIDVRGEHEDEAPLLPEHVREAWRIYRKESTTQPAAPWRMQGNGNGWMFR